MTMPSVHIGDIPATPDELEEYVAALFQSAGYFVEANVIERDETSILEIDAVATSYEDAVPRTVIAEAKSGGWGFADLFKVIGWMRYLGLEKGSFFVTKGSPDKPPALVNRKCSPLGLCLIEISADATAARRPSGMLVSARRSMRSRSTAGGRSLPPSESLSGSYKTRRRLMIR
jgi:hypothetical protein